MFATNWRSHSFAWLGLAAGLLSAAALLAVAAHAAPRADAANGPERTRQATAIQSANELERELLRALNDLRARAGLRPIRRSQGLAAAAAYHSRSMAERGYFNHTSSDGSRFWQRIERFYRRPPRWSIYEIGENLMRGPASVSAAAVMKSWLESPPHRRNLYAGWPEVGFGAVRVVGAPGVFDGQTVAIVTADFGARR